MAKPRLKNINGHFVESDYENALISFLENEGWEYPPPCIRSINGA